MSCLFEAESRRHHPEGRRLRRHPELERLARHEVGVLHEGRVQHLAIERAVRHVRVAAAGAVRHKAYYLW